MCSGLFCKCFYFLFIYYFFFFFFCKKVPVPPHDKRNLMEASRKGSFAFPIDQRLKEALENKARVGLRRLRREGVSEKTLETLRAFVEMHEGKGYESIKTVVKSRFRANTHDDAQELFCSELVALALMDLGIITRERLAANYLPSDFAQGTVPGASPDAFEGDCFFLSFFLSFTDISRKQSSFMGMRVVSNQELAVQVETLMHLESLLLEISRNKHPDCSCRQNRSRNQPNLQTCIEEESRMLRLNDKGLFVASLFGFE